MNQQQADFRVKLKPWQDKFVFSPKRYPGMWSSWATGKSLSLIARAMVYTELIPDNLGIIFRKEFEDLRDSTLKDFELYTGLKVNSNRNVTLPNNSTIMFRHIEELNNIQNINLGWYAIEQADELANDKEFFLLFGRLRRALKPTQEFLDLGLSLHTGFVIGNAGDHWGKALWKDGALDDAECLEAKTFDNSDVLPKSFLDSLQILKKNKPEIYAQFVMNDWAISADRYILIKPSEVEALKDMVIQEPSTKKIVSVDPAMGGDECPVYAFENSQIIDTLILNHKDTMKITGEIILFMAKHNINDVAIDVIGIGAGIADRLSELGKRVIRINSSESSANQNKFLNRRAEMWWYVSQVIQDRKIVYPADELLRKQLSSVRYKVINSNGKIQMEHKPDVKKRLGSSPDRADAFVYGIWGLQQVESLKGQDRYRRRSTEYDLNPATV